MNRAISVFKFSQKILGIIISLMLIGMVVVICMQTFCRTVIFRSIPWSEELSRYFFVWITVLGSSLAIMAVLAEFVYLRRGKDAVMKQAAEKEAAK